MPKKGEAWTVCKYKKVEGGGVFLSGGLYIIYMIYIYDNKMLAFVKPIESGTVGDLSSEVGHPFCYILKKTMVVHQNLFFSS